VRLAFRDAASEADRKFVISSWLDATRTSHDESLIAVDDWYPTMWPQREKMIARPDMRTIVAYEKSDPDFLYGWIVADPTEQRVPGRDGSVSWWPAAVVYVLVKQNYRREGIARRLFDAVGIDPAGPFLFASRPPPASRLASKVPLARYNPLVVRFKKEIKAA
jgi:GNAT superfamily N-acetyltransferase